MKWAFGKANEKIYEKIDFPVPQDAEHFPAGTGSVSHLQRPALTNADIDVIVNVRLLLASAADGLLIASPLSSWRWFVKDIFNAFRMSTDSVWLRT